MATPPHLFIPWWRLAALLAAGVALASLGCGGKAASPGADHGSGGTAGIGGGSASVDAGGGGGSGGTGADGSHGASTMSVSVSGGPATTGTTTTGGGGIGGVGGAPPEPGAARAICEQSSDCVVDQGCCGLCGVNVPADLIAVNQKYQSFLMPECQDVTCGQCGPPDAVGTFGAFCNAGSCEVFDLRGSPLSECTDNEDCRLRDGLNCCEGCGNSQWVAVSADLETVQAELCGEKPVNCDLCGPGEHSRLVATCAADGHCDVERSLL